MGYSKKNVSEIVKRVGFCGNSVNPAGNAPKGGWGKRKWGIDITAWGMILVFAAVGILLAVGIFRWQNTAVQAIGQILKVSAGNSLRTIAYDGTNSDEIKNATESVAVIVKDGVTSVGNDAFEDCSRLESITISGTVTHIGIDVFRGCNSLSTIMVAEENPIYSSPNHCNAIIETDTNTLIAGCSGTVIPDSVTSIGYAAFSGCSLESITIPDSVTSIEGNAFDGCSNLTSITIPDSVTSIRSYVFNECSSLTSIAIPDSVTSMESNAFGKCESLSTIMVAKGNKTYSSPNHCNAIIETDTNTLIAGCSGTVIPDSVTSIGENAFYGCSNLISITIPDSVTSIESNAFEKCNSLSTIMVAEGNKTYSSPNHCNAIIETDTNKLILGGNGTVIPNTVISIGDWAFSGRSSLTSITIPNSVTSIGECAFYECTGLTSITIPDSVRVIREYAFCHCSSLTSITIPDSVTSIGGVAFSGCTGLTSITIPDSVTSIGIIAFSECSSLTSITIPDSVSSIGEGAFLGCTGLTSVTIPDSVSSIGGSVFEGCSSLTSIKWKGATYICEDDFREVIRAGEGE